MKLTIIWSVYASLSISVVAHSFVYDVEAIEPGKWYSIDKDLWESGHQFEMSCGITYMTFEEWRSMEESRESYFWDWLGDQAATALDPTYSGSYQGEVGSYGGD